MSGKIITISTNKGGAGKTTITSNLACDFAVRNPDKNICLIDLDGQCGISVMFGQDPKNYTNNSILSFINGQKELKDVATNEIINYKEGTLKNLYIVPAEIALQEFDVQVTKNSILRNHLLETINFLKTKFDYVFIDTQPAISTLNKIVYSLADLIISPFELEMQNVEGFMRVIDEFRDNNIKNNPFITLLPVKVKERVNLDIRLLDYVKNTLVAHESKWNNKIKLLNTRIPFSTQYKSAVARDHLPLILSKSKAKAVETQKELIRSISDEIIQLLK